MPSTIVKRLPELREQSKNSHKILSTLKTTEYKHRISQRKWQMTGYTLLFAALGYLGYKGYQQGIFTSSTMSDLFTTLTDDNNAALRTSIAGIGAGFYGLWVLPSDAKLDSLPEKTRDDVAKSVKDTATPLPSPNPTLQEGIHHFEKINKKIEKEIDEVLSQRDIVKVVLQSKHSKNNHCPLYDSFWSAETCEPQVFNQIFSYMGFNFLMKESHHRRLQLRAAKAEGIIKLLELKEHHQKANEHRGQQLLKESALPVAATTASYLYSRQENHSIFPLIATGVSSLLFMAYKAYQHASKPSKATLQSLKPFEQKMVTDVLTENKLDTDLNQTLQHTIQALQQSKEACKRAMLFGEEKSAESKVPELKHEKYK